VRDAPQHYYSAIFVLSSFVTPLMLGIVAGGMLRTGRRIEEGFHQAFVRPWATFLSCGRIHMVLCRVPGAVILIGETSNPAVGRFSSGGSGS